MGALMAGCVAVAFQCLVTFMLTVDGVPQFGATAVFNSEEALAMLLAMQIAMFAALVGLLRRQLVVDVQWKEAQAARLAEEDRIREEEERKVHMPCVLGHGTRDALPPTCAPRDALA